MSEKWLIKFLQKRRTTFEAETSRKATRHHHDRRQARGWSDNSQPSASSTAATRCQGYKTSCSSPHTPRQDKLECLLLVLF